MLISFLKHGTGSARKASGYVLSAAAGLQFKHRYTSGVIAWAAEDRPDDAQIEAVLDDFEQLAFAGLSPDRCWRNH